MFDVTQVVVGRVQSTDTQILIIKRRDDHIIAAGKMREFSRLLSILNQSNLGGTAR